MVFRNSFDALSLALEDEEDNIAALMTFSLSPTTAAPLHVSIEPQHNKNKHQKHKTFHSKPKSYTTFTKKPSPNLEMRSIHSSMEKQPSPMANANDMVFNSYLRKNYGRNPQSSKSPTTPWSHAILANCLGVPPHALHIFHGHLHNNPHIVSHHPHDATTQMLLCGKCTKLFSNNANFLPHLKTFILCHSEASHAQSPKLFQHCPSAHIFGLCILCVKFVAAL